MSLVNLPALALCAALGLAPVGFGTLTLAREGTFRELTPEQALEAAGKEGKLALLVFLDSKLQPCKAYDGFTFVDPSVATWIAEHVVAVRRVDDEDGARSFDVHNAPALVFASPEGAEVDRIDTFLEPGPFLEAAGKILARQSPTALAQQAVDKAPEDARARQELARVLLKRKRWLAALTQLAWIYDHTRGDPAWDQERMAFAVERAGSMRRNVPEPAQAWLVERRERARDSLVAERAEPAPEGELALAARELVALNEALGEIRETVKCWDAVRPRPDYPRAALLTLFNRATQSILIEEKRYADLLAGAGDPLVVIQEGISRLRALDEAAGPQREGVRPHDHERWALVEEASRYFLALVAVGNEADANALADLVLGLEPSAKAYQSLVAAAQVAERYDLAQALLERGLAALPEGIERQRLQTYAQRMQKKGS
jgi:hypothetical protein